MNWQDIDLDLIRGPFTGYACIHCNTHEEADALFAALSESGLRDDDEDDDVTWVPEFFDGDDEGEGIWYLIDRAKWQYVDYYAFHPGGYDTMEMEDLIVVRREEEDIES